MLLKSNKQFSNCNSRILPVAFYTYFCRTNSEGHVFQKTFSHINGNLYHYAANNPVKYTDPDGNHAISFMIFRGKETRESTTNFAKRGQDTIQFINNETGEKFTMTNSQTVVSHSDYSGGNTLAAFEGEFSIKYLGNNQESGQILKDGEQSQFMGPVFDVQNAYTESLHKINSYGFDTKDSSPNPAPFRVHSNYSLKLTKDNAPKGALPMASGGCPMYDYKYGAALADFLQRGNVKPGDSIKGSIKEDVGP